MPYNVRIELEPKGEQTECVTLDLELIKRCQYVRKNREIIAVLFVYNNDPGPSVLEGAAARSFVEKYEKFLKQDPERTIIEADEEAEPSAILVASSSIGSNIKNLRN